MGTDTECDLAIEAQQRGPSAPRIATVRARLLADHCGVPAQEAAAAIASRRR